MQCGPRIRGPPLHALLLTLPNRFPPLFGGQKPSTLYSALLVFGQGFYFEISCFVILKMPYRSERKRRAYFRNLDKARKKECNRDYYVCNSDTLNARGRSLYEGDPSKKKAAAAALYKLQPDKKNASDIAYYNAHKEERNASDIKLSLLPCSQGRKECL